MTEAKMKAIKDAIDTGFWNQEELTLEEFEEILRKSRQVETLDLEE